MQDLLNEKEFLQKPYSPWKLFYIFYIIAFIQLILFISIALLAEGQMEKALIAAVLLPDITALAMFFFRKKNALLRVETVATATILLFGIYYIPISGFAIIGGGTFNDIILILVFGIANYLLCFGIMYLVMRSRQKKNKDNTAAKT